MFNTIKSKIIIITLTLFSSLCAIWIVFSFIIYDHGFFFVKRGCAYNIAILKEKINQELMEFENNVSYLALLGEIYYESSHNKQLAQKTLVNIINDYPHILGGGVWYEPYILEKNQKNSNIYIYKNKSNKIIIDDNYGTKQNDYLEQSWYKEIKSGLKDKRTKVWSRPYFEDNGNETLMVTIGSGMYKDDKLIGLATIDWKISSILRMILRVSPTQNSFALFADKNRDYILVNTDKYLAHENFIGKSLNSVSWYKEGAGKISTIFYRGQKYISFYNVFDNGMILIVNVPEVELSILLVNDLVLLLGSFLFLIGIMSVFVYITMKKIIIKPIHKLTDMANKIKNGNLDTEIKIEDPKEFENLASTFDMMTKSVKKILREKEYYQLELQIAKEIQKSSLPNEFPPFPQRKEIDIYATMETAKEVGGDFYDFYFIEENKLMFLVADVSGKGIPACLFMMTTKTIMNNISHFESSPEKLIKKINKAIYESNKQGFFVTMLMGIFDLKTRNLIFINCGHNPPLVKRNGKFEYLEMESNIVLGLLEDYDYKINEIQLKSGDMVFLYTDGLTEAINSKDEQYGETRLLENINRQSEKDISDILNELNKDVQEHMGTMEQSDDTTMLIFEYNEEKTNNVKKYKCSSLKENYRGFNEWLLSTCSIIGVAPELMLNIELSSEEIYTNIISYGYPIGQVGEIEVMLSNKEGEVELTFIDDGIAYNPLEKEDPKTKIDIDENGVGGWGIFIVKQLAREITYEYKYSKNMLTMKF